MKLTLLKGFLGFLVIVLSISSNVNAQSYLGELEFNEAKFRIEKRAEIAKIMKIDRSDVFWKLYDEYDTECRLFSDRRIKMLYKYVDNYTTLTDSQVDELLQDIRKQQKGLDKLIHKYYKSIRKNKDAKTAARFYFLENYFLNLVRSQIMAQIPLKNG